MGITPDDRLSMELYSKAFAGMPIRSRCYNYEVCMYVYACVYTRLRTVEAATNCVRVYICMSYVCIYARALQGHETRKKSIE